MNENIKKILDSQISNGFDEWSVEPTVNDVLDHHTFLFSVKGGLIQSIESLPDNSWESSVRVQQMLPFLIPALRKSDVKDLKFFIYTCDHSAWCGLDEKFPVLSFCKVSDQNAITIPNIDFYSGVLESVLAHARATDISYTNKKNSSFFAGASTNPKRMEYCEKVLNSKQHEAVITNVVGNVDREDWPNFEKYVEPRFISQNEQMKHKFLVNIDGYAACYSRLYWQMSSNSVPVYLNRDKSYEQLHDYLIEPDQHYVDTTFERWPAVFQELDDDACKSIVSKGKEFCMEHFTNLNEKTIDILSYTFAKMQEAKQW